MNIYQKKQKWKIWLSSSAVLIIAASLWYSSQIVNEIASEERKKAVLWADAVRNKASLVKTTEKLFERLKAEERKRVKIWAEAIKNSTITIDEDARKFYLKVVRENNDIPAAIIDDQQEVISIANYDTAGFGKKIRFTGKIKSDFSAYEPIEIPDGFSSTYFIYYSDSKVFIELRKAMDNIVKSFVEDVKVNSASVPVIISDGAQKKIIDHSKMEDGIERDTTSLLSLAADWSEINTPLRISLPEYGDCLIFYQNSTLLTQLRYYPLIQFSVITLFIIVAYFLFSFSRRAEQNQVWVGMSKETAHQLGTPLSSLIAWMEILRLKGVDEETISEINKDIKRLEVVTERFSKIGSVPELHEKDLGLVIRECAEYMRSRISKKISMEVIPVDAGEKTISVKLNVQLFDWVIENLYRNAADAMEGNNGSIRIEYGKKGKWAFVDFSDTGKGIPKSMLRTVFEPGYTSKKRGWGLGLSLSKRIIENYHKGKIYVKHSEPGKGTTFRISLPI